MSSTAMRAMAGAVLALLALTPVSCSERPPAVYPVRGSLTYRDKPAAGAVVTLVPHGADKPPDYRPGGVVGADGTFRIGTRGTADGAPAGSYAVTVVYPKTEQTPDGEDSSGPDQLKGKFSDPKTTPFKIEVKPGENDLEPFRIP